MTMPFPIKEYETRIKKCQSWMEKEKFEAILAYSMGRWSMMAGRECGGNGIYYIGFNYPHQEMRQKGGLIVPYISKQNLVFIPKKGDPSFLISTARSQVSGSTDEQENIKKQVWIKDIKLVTSNSEFIKKVNLLFQENGLDPEGKIGIGGKQTPMELWVELQRTFPNATLETVTHKLHLLRMVKSENELKILRKAFEINDFALYTLIDMNKPGYTEWEVHQAMEATMFKHGADNVWTTVHSGPRSWARNGPDFTQRVLKKGDMINIDYGNEYYGYHTDTNYAMAIGQASKQQKEIIKLVIKMMDSMISVTKAGVTDTEIYVAALKVTEGSPYKKYIGNFFGHAYGCGGENLSLDRTVLNKLKEQETMVEANTFMCYEPNVYMPGVGGVNLEDGLIVKKDGCEVITHNLYEAKKALNLT
jgi:Xaa-Pro aminopeptidase